MKIWHVDRTGASWEFETPFTPIQNRIFERTIRIIHTVGGNESLSLSYIENEKENAKFRAELERRVLSALKEWTTTATSTDEYIASDTTAVPDPEPAPAAQPQAIPEPVEEREPYYWEKF